MKKRETVMIYYMDMRDTSFKKAVSTDNIDTAHSWKRSREHGIILIYEASATKRNIDAMSGALEFIQTLSRYHHVVFENVSNFETLIGKRNRS